MSEWKFLASSVWDYLFFFYLLLYCAPLLLGASRLAEKVCGKNPYERFAFTMLASLVCGGMNFGVCGVLKILSVQYVFLGNLLWGACLLLLGKFLPEKGRGTFLPEETLPEENAPVPWGERLLAGFLAFWVVSRLYPVISMPPFGTDSYMYHLYFPAEWIQRGGLERISIIGLFPEYYPVFGELLYGFLLLPLAENAAFASPLQWGALVMACSCMVFLAQELGYSRGQGLFVSCILFCTSIVMMNLLMAYTDTLNACLCFAGFCFLLAGCKRNSLYLLLFAGVLMGCSTAVKPLGMLWSPVITLVFSLVFLRIYRPSFRRILLLYLAAILTALPFFLKNWAETGNPLYPQTLSLFGVTIFSPGIKASVYEPIGLRNFPQFLFDGGIFGFNKASVLLCILSGTGALVCLLTALFSSKAAEKIFPEEKGGKVLKIFIPVILLFTLVHVLVYPRIAEPRSLILLLLFWGVFFLPILEGTRIHAGKWGSLSLAGILLGCILPWSSFTTNFLTWGFNWGMGCAGMILFLFFRNRKIMKKGALILLLLLTLLVPYQQTVRGAGKKEFFKMMFHPAEYLSLELVQEMFRKGEKSVIDYVGGVFGYAYMEDMAGNRVLYVPISEKDSTFVHEFGSYEKMRENPAGYEVWKERLKREKVNLLIVKTDTPALIFNRRQELDWAQAHPENFTLLVRDSEEWEKSSFFMYRVHDL